MSGKKRQKNINNQTVAKEAAVKEKEATAEEKDTVEKEKEVVAEEKEAVTEEKDTAVEEKDTVEKEEETKAADTEIEEIREFVVSSEKTRSERKKAEQASISAIAAWSSRKKSIAVLILFAAVALAYTLVGILACEVNAVVVCIVLLIQVAIGVLLDQNPIWLHACVAAADVIAGICVGQTLLMVAAVFVYVAAIVALEALQRMGFVPVKKEA